MSHDLRTEEGAKEFATLMIEAARLNFEASYHLSPVVFLLITKHPKTGAKLRFPFPVTFDVHALMTPEGKGTLPETLRQMAEASEAVGILFITECWTLSVDPTSISEVQRWLEEHGDLEKYPGRTEAVSVHYEHRALGEKIWQAPITRNPDGTAQLGDFEEIKANHEGLFVGLLPKGAN